MQNAARAAGSHIAVFKAGSYSRTMMIFRMK
jgi:hypothetical protein